MLGETPNHPSLQLKPVGGFWSARVTDAYLVLSVREGNVFTWFWIGPHDEYERLLQGLIDAGRARSAIHRTS